MFARHAFVAVLTLSAAATAFAQQGEVNKRIENQADRIQAGQADGQLTDKQADHLEKNDAKIHAQEKQDRAQNGGNLTNNEKAQLNRELNRNSRQIRRARHN